MKLVVDSNVLFTFFWKASVFKNFLDTPIQLFSPEYALEEIDRYSLEIMKKTSLSKERFKKLKQELALKIEFISLKEYSPLFHKTLTIASYVLFRFEALRTVAHGIICSIFIEFTEGGIVKTSINKQTAACPHYKSTDANVD